MQEIKSSIFVGQYKNADEYLNAGYAIKRLDWNGYWILDREGKFKVVDPSINSITATYLLTSTTFEDWVVCSSEYIKQYNAMFESSEKYHYYQKIQQEAQKKAEAAQAAQATQMVNAPVQNQEPVKTKKIRSK
jgi:hypothetical protein